MIKESVKQEQVNAAVLDVVLDLHRITLSGQRFANGNEAREYHEKFKRELLQRHDLLLMDN